MQRIADAPSRFTDATAIHLLGFQMDAGDRFGQHRHDQHQLAWSSTGVLTAEAGGHHWRLPSTLGLWIPSDVLHDVSTDRDGIVHNLYFPREHCPLAWTEPTAVTVTPLLREVIARLGEPDLDPDRRARAEQVVFDELQAVEISACEVPMPSDPRALDLAHALLADPACTVGLESLAREVGASRRTLARLFAAETGLTFSQWRTRVRVRAALSLLDDGRPTVEVAHRVGYANASAFIATFQRVVGTTPGAYAAAARVAAAPERHSA